MPDEAFGSLLAFTDIEEAVLGHYQLWMDTWLAARERQQVLTVGTIARPRSYLVKQTFTALPGEESTPTVVAVSDGFSVEPTRRGTGRWDALFRFGIAVVCLGNDGGARTLCGHYQTALVGIATRHRVIRVGLDNAVLFDDLVDLRIEDIDEEAIGRSMAAVRMVAVYRAIGFAAETPVPGVPGDDGIHEPPPDVVPPGPDDPRVETVDVDVEKYQADEVIP
jgi:hypothetical protein